METLKTKVCIIGSGPAAQTAAIYAARAELNPLLFEGSIANDIAPGDQLTTTTDVENFPGFPEGILGPNIAAKFRKQSERFGTKIFTETVNKVDFSSKPFKIFTDSRTVLADAVIISTGAIAKRFNFTGSDGFWNRGISACAVCDGAAPMFRNKPLVVIGGGDSAMEEANFLTKYGSKVYIIHRRDTFRASKIMQRRAFSNPKIEVILNSLVVEAYGDENGKGFLGGLKVKNVVTGYVAALKASGLFFAIGHEPGTKFLDGQLELDEDGYVVTKPGTTKTSVDGVFAAGDVQDKKYRQAITAAGTGCMAALDAEHYLQGIGSQELRVIREDVGERPNIIIRADPLTEITEGSNSKRATRCTWSPTDDGVLISAWLNTSKDPFVGNEQRAAAFWKRVAAYFSSSPAVASLPKREWNHCKSRWQKINDSVSKFAGCYDHALSQRIRGQSEDDVLQVAYDNYFNHYEAKFTLERAWRKLRHDPKWCTSYMSQNSRTSGSSKRARFNEVVTVSSSSNSESSVEEQAMGRPDGVKSPKLKEKMVVPETTTTNEERESNPRSRLEKLWALNEKDITERHKLSRVELLRSFLDKTGKLSEKEEALKNKLIDEMM